MPDPTITVLLAEDHSLVRRGFRRLLEDHPCIRVIAEAEDGHQAVQLAADLKPRVVVMDFAMPSMNGSVAARQMLSANPALAILILSMHSEASIVRTCLEAGARGYLLKNAKDLEMVAAVKQVAAGKQVLDPRLGTIGDSIGERSPGLTTRELEVLQLIVHGKSNKEIAAVLKLSANTIAVHRANIMQSFGVHNTADLVVHAIRQGLVSIT